MRHDDLFRLIFLAILVVFLPLGLYHRLRSMTGEKLDRWEEGTFILFGLRLSALLFFIGCMAWMIDPMLIQWASVPIPLWLRWCGFVLIGFWAILFVWTFRTLGRNLTDTVVTRRDHTLVTSGPYQYVRHPFYLSFVIALVGGSVVAANLFLLLIGLIPFAFLVVRTRIEEAKLIERFGDDYRNYIARTGRFLPRPAWVPVTMVGLSVLLVSAGSFFWPADRVDVEPLTFPRADEMRRSGDFLVIADRRVFAVMAFLNAAGFDQEMQGEPMHPVRLKVRQELQERLEQHPEKLTRWRDFYRDKELAPFYYIDFALSLNADFPFRRIRPTTELNPYIAQQLHSFPGVLNEFWATTDLGSIWREVKPDYVAELDKYDLVTAEKEIAFVWNYLRMERSDNFTLVAVPNLLDQRAHGKAAHFENYWYSVESPGAIRYGLNVHEYLHSMVNPLIIENMEGHEQKLAAYLEAGKDGPLVQTYQDLTIFTYECLVRALERRIQIRFNNNDAVRRRAESRIAYATQNGLTLTKPFYDMLFDFEEGNLSFKEFVPLLLQRLPEYSNQPSENDAE